MNRVDTHCHIWDLAVRPHTWLDYDGLQPLQRNFAVDDVAADARAAGITSAILVQSLPLDAETADLLDVAAGDDFVAAVVGWADVEAADIAAQLAAQQQRDVAGKLVGIRDMAQVKAVDWFARDDVIAGLRTVGAHGLSYDVLIDAEQLPAVITAVRACPDVRFIVDHMAKPPLATGELEPWAGNIRTLAREPNVAMKLSSLCSRADATPWREWSVGALRPFADTVLEAFGPGRLMFGSDWPMCTLAASYATVVATAAELTSGLSGDESDEFWGGAARRFYGLPVSPVR